MLPLALGAAVAAGLVGCGGGGGDNSAGVPGPTTTASTVSSGVITAFGSVFVNGHRFRTERAKVIDDDTGQEVGTLAGLEVGMVVDVKHRGDDDEAEELHIHPLTRGFVDAADTSAGTVTVMGQSVQLTSATSFSDHRGCLSAAAPCTPITTAAGLVATTVNGTTTVPGSYVTVHGFLFDGTTADIVATLVAIGDKPVGNSPFNFKAEGVATVTTTTVSINGLKLDLTNAKCVIPGQPNSCSALANGRVISAGSATAPALPATLLKADIARQLPKVFVETPGATVELEGVVSSVGTTTFVLRGITVDTSGLPAGTAMPKVGDEVRVLGTLSADGATVKATSLSTEHEARAAKLALAGDVTSVTGGTGTFTITVLGQNVTVNAQTRLVDLTVLDRFRKDPTVNPFNITNFQSYLNASASKDVLVIAEIGANGALVAKSLAIIPATDLVAVAGTVDATPVPVNGTGGTGTVFFVHGIQVKADPADVLGVTSRGPGKVNATSPTTVKAGDQVVAVGKLAGAVITVSGPATDTNRVLDFGVQREEDHDRDRGLF
jgi:hypothetical protein